MQNYNVDAIIQSIEDTWIPAIEFVGVVAIVVVAYVIIKKKIKKRNNEE